MKNLVIIALITTFSLMGSAQAQDYLKPKIEPVSIIAKPDFEGLVRDAFTILLLPD